MENEKKNYSLKSKLISAIAMLLVATIMLVSSTYAWFTLSTKPEVSGISTAVGANGALEMLLATKDTNGNWVYGDGSVKDKDAYQRNTHWGNLVDLSLEDYGSGLITLYPSVLSITPDSEGGLGTLNVGTPIETPEYGADGRVEDVKAGGMFALYDTVKKVFLEKNNNYGFRAIGKASGLTARQQAFRVAIAQIMVNSSAAQVSARNALAENGSTLGGIAIKKAMTPDDPYTKEEIKSVGLMIAGVREALTKIEDAYLEIIYASILAANSSAENDDAATLAVTAAQNAAKAETSGVLGAKITAATGTFNIDPTTLKSYEIFTAAVGKLSTAENGYAEIKTAESCTWAELNTALYPLVDITKITINGHAVGDVKNNTGAIATDVMQGNGINVVIPSQGGVFADIADYTGDYTVGIKIDTDDLNTGVGVGEIDAIMKADSTYSQSILAVAKDTVNENYPEGTSGDNPITEFYGYAIDLAFKTNASTSKLLLQTAAADRIYGDNNNEETAGNGSTMTFKTTDPTFSKEKMLGLMSKLKVVFYDTTSNEILAYAKLDTEAKNVTGSAVDGLTSNLYIVKKVTEQDDSGNTVTTEQLVTKQADAAIVELGANVAQHVTVLLYLDGEGINNKDVAAIASDARSMTGTFNIQFASSVELVPMDYSDLHTATPKAPETPANPETPVTPEG